MTVIIAVDESGDLGFRFEKKGTTRFLVLAFVFTKEYEYVRKHMRRTLRKLVSRKMWPAEPNELKFTISKTKARRRGLDYEKYVERIKDVRLAVLDKMGKLPFSAAVSIVEKELVDEPLRVEPGILYNYVLVHPLIARFIETYNPSPFEETHIVLDKRLGSRAMASLRSYINRKYDYMVQSGRISYHARIRATQKASYSEPLIWLADYVAGSVRLYFEQGVQQYVKRLSGKIFDCIYFWGKPEKCEELKHLK